MAKRRKPDTVLEPVREAIANGDHACALEFAIIEWSLSQASELGDLVDALDARVPVEPFTAPTAKWVAFAKQASTVERGALLRGIANRTFEDTQRCLKIAVAWRDPRLTRVLIALLQQLPWVGRRSRDGWRAIFAVVAAHADPRVLPVAATLPPTWTIGGEMQTFLSNRFAEAVSDIPAPESSPEAVALLALLGDRAQPAAGAPVTEAALLAAIYEHPDDDAPRTVYADWLQEREDPRGEFIALQLRADPDAAATKRASALLKKHRKEWLGPLAAALKGEVEYRRGFPAVAMATFRHQRDVDQHGHHAAWATLEELSWGASTNVRDDCLKWSCAVTAEMIGLRIAHQPNLELLLAATRPWQIERLEIDARSLDPDRYRALLRAPLLPKLSHLWVRGGGSKPSWLAGVTACPPHLEFNVAIDDGDRDGFVARAEQTAAHTLTLHGYPRYLARYSRDTDGKFTRLDITLDYDIKKLDPIPKPVSELDGKLKQLKFRSLSHLDITLGTGDDRVSVAHLMPQVKRIVRS